MSVALAHLHLHPGGYTPSVELLSWFGYLSFARTAPARDRSPHSFYEGVWQIHCVLTRECQYGEIPSGVKS